MSAFFEAIYKGIVAVISSIALLNPFKHTSQLISPLNQTNSPVVQVNPTLTQPSILLEISPSPTFVIIIPTATQTPTLVVSKVIQNIPTIVPTLFPTQSKSVKACFTYYGEAVKDGVVYYGKNVTFDASCSENATEYHWYVSSHPIYDGLKFTKCYQCNTGNPDLLDKVFEYKLYVIGENGESNSIIQLIQFKKSS